MPVLLLRQLFQRVFPSTTAMWAFSMSARDSLAGVEAAGAAAVAGLPPAGPELRRKPLTVVLPASDGPKVVRPLCVEDGGFSLHAASRVGAEDDLGRTNLFRYVLRPPIAQEHLTLTDDGLVAIQLKKPFRDGTVSVEMDPSDRTAYANSQRTRRQSKGM